MDLTLFLSLCLSLSLSLSLSNNISISRIPSFYFLFLDTFSIFIPLFSLSVSCTVAYRYLLSNNEKYFLFLCLSDFRLMAIVLCFSCLFLYLFKHVYTIIVSLYVVIFLFFFRLPLLLSLSLFLFF